jgi:hypothetical protein
MRCSLPALLLASFLGLGLTSSALRAQGCEECSKSKDHVEGESEKYHPVGQWLKDRPCFRWVSNQCCWAHHNTLGCSSLASEYMFMFGSCRQFYGEPCFKGPPPPPGQTVHPKELHPAKQLVPYAAP